jgi:hypothetical protein
MYGGRGVMSGVRLRRGWGKKGGEGMGMKIIEGGRIK